MHPTGSPRKTHLLSSIQSVGPANEDAAANEQLQQLAASSDFEKVKETRDMIGVASSGRPVVVAPCTDFLLAFGQDDGLPKDEFCTAPNHPLWCGGKEQGEGCSVLCRIGRTVHNVCSQVHDLRELKSTYAKLGRPHTNTGIDPSTLSPSDGYLHLLNIHASGNFSNLMLPHEDFFDLEKYKAAISGVLKSSAEDPSISTSSKKTGPRVAVADEGPQSAAVAKPSLPPPVVEDNISLIHSIPDAASYGEKMEAWAELRDEDSRDGLKAKELLEANIPVATLRLPRALYEAKNAETAVEAEILALAKMLRGSKVDGVTPSPGAYIYVEEIRGEGAIPELRIERAKAVDVAMLPVRYHDSPESSKELVIQDFMAGVFARLLPLPNLPRPDRLGHPHVQNGREKQQRPVAAFHFPA